MWLQIYSPTCSKESFSKHNNGRIKKCVSQIMTFYLTKYRSDSAYEARLLQKDSLSNVMNIWTLTGSIYIQTKFGLVKRICING